MTFFAGGPLDGQATPDAMADPAAAGGAPTAGGGAPTDLTPGEMFEQMLTLAVALRASGTLSEQNKLNLERATTLIQQVRASEEKDEEQAMGGKLTPGVLRKLGQQ